MMHPDAVGYDWSEHHQRLLQANQNVLSRTSQSLARSTTVALETEQVGTEVLADLSSQRDSLLNTRDALNQADSNLTRSSLLLRKMGRNIFYNKVLLFLIIVLELLILLTVVYLKFIRR